MPRTTENLREMLMDAIEQVKSGAMDTRQAGAVAKLAEGIIKTAELEIQYALTCSRLDKDGQGINPGPLLLTSDAVKK